MTVSPGQPGSISDDAEVVTLVGSGQDAANLINQKEIHWGVGHLSHEVDQFIFPNRIFEKHCSSFLCSCIPNMLTLLPE